VTDSDRLATALLESDRRYFELAARVVPLTGAVLAVVPGIPVAAAGVVHRVDPDAIAAPDRWVAEVLEVIRDSGLPLARVYLDRPASRLESALARGGFGSRVEIGFLATDPIDAAGPVTLRPIRSEGDWEKRAKVHLDAPTPDGHDADALAWQQLERLRCDSGGMRAYVAERDGEPLGAVCMLEDELLVRNKNLVTLSRWQRQGVASAVLAELDGMARGTGRVLGTFAVEGSAGEALYRSLGMAEVLRQIEWSRD
jgi:GNAT superfamily N-acetyltransferase